MEETLTTTDSAEQQSNPNWSVYSSSINGLVQAAEMLSVPIDRFLAREGIEREALKDPDKRFPVMSLFNLYESIALAGNCPDLGLYTGRISHINGLNLQLYMSTVCRTFREYLNLMPSVLRFAGDIGEVKIKGEGGFIRLEWQPLWSETSHHRFLSDELLVTSAAIVNSLCIQPIPVIKAHFTYPEPDDLTQLKAFFGDDLSFDQPVSCLYFERASLDFPLTQMHMDLSKAVSRPSRLFDEQHEEDVFLTELRTSILKLLPAGEMSIDTVAAELNVSRRTLQRRLSDRDTQFVQVLQGVRKDLSLSYLSDERLGITDIAFLLGYADQSSFSSAFKSWHGMSPREYRQR